MAKLIAILHGPAKSRTHYVLRAYLLVGFFMCLFLVGCNRQRPTVNQTPDGKATLLAQPNPVPAGDDQSLGTTVITWNTGSGIIGELWVKVDRGQEAYVTSMASGSMEVNWIQFDSVYEFRLYAEGHSKLLAKLAVTRDD